MSREELVVLGAGGHAKVVVSTLQAAGFTVAALYDDDPERQGGEILGVRVRGPLAALDPTRHRRGVIAVGDNAARRRLAESVRLAWLTVVHPQASVHPSARLGEGTVVFAGAVIQPDAVLGRHVIVNTAATVDHDCVIGDFVHLAPGSHLAGGVQVGEGALLGVGTAVIPGLRIGAWAIVGAGSAVVRDLAPGVTAVGAPARALAPEGGRKQP